MFDDVDMLIALPITHDKDHTPEERMLSLFITRTKDVTHLHYESGGCLAVYLHRYLVAETEDLATRLVLLCRVSNFPFAVTFSGI